MRSLRAPPGVVLVALVMTAFLAITLAACGTAPTLTPSLPKLGVMNGTTLTVTVTINGHATQDVPPGSMVPAATLEAEPALPWTVEVKSPSGRVLATMYLGTQVESSTGSTRADFDLSCGRITLGPATSSRRLPRRPGERPATAGRSPRPSSTGIGRCRSMSVAIRMTRSRLAYAVVTRKTG